MLDLILAVAVKVVPAYLTHLSLGGALLHDGRGGVVPPGQRGAEPLHLAQVDEEGAVRAVHPVEGVAGVRGPPGPHPLKQNSVTRGQKQCQAMPASGVEH